MSLVRLTGLAAAVLLVPMAVSAQEIVSARAGLIHYSDGRVLLNEKPIVHKVAQFQEVKENEYLRTERGRAEVLLTPGIFLRLGEDSQVQMLSSRLSDVRFRLLSGAAVIEADELDKSNHVTVVVGDSEVRILRTGLYRLDASEEEPARLRVIAGEALVEASGAEYRVKSKKEVELAGNFEIKKFNVEDTDALDRWSKRRANNLAIANVSASRLAYNRGMSFSSSRWMWNPYFGMFTFLPYRSVCWSPYGYGFYSPRAVYTLYNPPRPAYNPGDAGGHSGSFNRSYGYSTMGQTATGNSGVIASHGASGGSVGASAGGGASSGGVSRGSVSGAGGGARR